jgi:hypothetical protein
MTQVGEPVTLGQVDDDEYKCPFDHDEPKPPKVDNALVGSGSKLRDRMKAGDSTCTFGERYSPKVTSVDNPKDVPGHALYQKPGAERPRPVSFTVSDGGKSATPTFPVTCAAHHCIPAQESLKRSDLLNYMISKTQADKLKNGSETFDRKGEVWSDIGYDVNGTENGVYLPGNYAVGGGRGGMGVWEEPDGDADNDDELDFLGEQPVNDGELDSLALTGPLYEVENQNRKWRYVKGAMDAAGGQFHDRHETYSDFVLEVLQKINSNLNRLRKESITAFRCDDCRARKDKIKNLGIPAPYGLVNRLNGVSAKMRGHLSGKVWPQNVYTSDWVKVYLQKLKRANTKRAGRSRK